VRKSMQSEQQEAFQNLQQKVVKTQNHRSYKLEGLQGKQVID